MKITIIYDNYAANRDLKAHPGFSCLIDTEDGYKLLFDTGTEGDILLSNMEKLGISADSFSEVFISHDHYDHTGGLEALLKLNPGLKVYVPKTCSKPKGAKKVVTVTEGIEIHKDLFSTGEIAGVEQSVLVRTAKGIVVVAGCSHSGVGNILKTASELGRVHALIGGFHGFDEYDVLKDLDMVCPTHCTRHIREIKEKYPEKYLEGGVGKKIVFV